MPRLAEPGSRDSKQIDSRHPGEEPVLALLSLEGDDLNQVVNQLLTVLDEELELTEAYRDEVYEQLREHADLGPEVLDHGVAVIHAQLEELGPPIQALVRLPSQLAEHLHDKDHKPTHFLWVLLSSQPTHPHLDEAAEFSRLMERDAFRQAALDAGNATALDNAYHAALARDVGFASDVPPELRATGKIFGGVRADIARRAPLWLGDFKDGLTGKSLASVFFLYFACLAPAVAFGGLLDTMTGGAIGAIEMLVATAICGIAYALFAGQPLTILGSTGPVIIFLAILHGLCARFEVPYMATLGWVGLWTMVILLVLAATDACALIRFFTRFTDDTFAALITIIFISEALTDIIRVFTGHQVSYATALLSLVLSLGTYIIAINLARFRSSPYLRRGAREFFADFGPTIAIASMSAVAYMLHEVELRTLKVPVTFATTSGRPWMVDLWEAPPWVWGAAIIPAMLVSILLYLDQNITVRLVNDAQYKLKKGSGYHLDLAIVGVLVGVCSLFGLPWMVAATVRSLNHVRSLAKVEIHHGQEQTVGVIENRMTGLLVHVLIALSLLVLPLLATVPMSVLFGLFLFMGVASIRGNQLFERLRLWVLDPLHYPPLHYLRAVPRLVVHRFTGVQLACLIVLWMVKASSMGILFPLFVGLLVPVRIVLGRAFKSEHLALLDAEETPTDEEYRETE
jgi:mannitol/fructose-specific phosphotransferase system IIA component (Ntr-type)